MREVPEELKTQIQQSVGDIVTNAAQVAPGNTVAVQLRSAANDNTSPGEETHKLVNSLSKMILAAKHLDSDEGVPVHGRTTLDGFKTLGVVSRDGRARRCAELRIEPQDPLTGNPKVYARQKRSGILRTGRTTQVVIDDGDHYLVTSQRRGLFDNTQRITRVTRV